MVLAERCAVAGLARLRGWYLAGLSVIRLAGGLVGGSMRLLAGRRRVRRAVWLLAGRWWKARIVGFGTRGSRERRWCRLPVRRILALTLLLLLLLLLVLVLAVGRVIRWLARCGGMIGRARRVLLRRRWGLIGARRGRLVACRWRRAAVSSARTRVGVAKVLPG